MDKSKEIITQLLSSVGVTVGNKGNADIIVNDERFYRRVLASGSLGLGESYVEGWWDCKDLQGLFYKICRTDIDEKANRDLMTTLHFLKSKVFNLQTTTRSFYVGKKHYDLGNNLFKLMLGKRMVYSCGYWKTAKTLDKAQEDKLDLICRKLGLKKGDRLLDIGCGWGELLKFAAEKYGVKGVGVTVSKEQAELARQICRGLPIKIRLQDYRSLNEKFDHIVSVGMFEHVGRKNYKEYMSVVSRCLKQDGLFLLHTIGSKDSKNSPDPWLLKYIFPNSITPSPEDIVSASNKIFVMEDWHNFGTYYQPTLTAWHENINKNWAKVTEKYDERFRRMWNYYLLCCAGSFQARNSQLWQIVFSKGGIVGGYKSIR